MGNTRATNFIEKYPNAEIRGGPLLGIQSALGEVAQPYFERAGLNHIEVDHWYSLRLYLDVIYDIMENELGAMVNAVSIGMKTIEKAVLPPEVDTIEKALMMMQKSWEMNSRPATEIIWITEQVDADTFIVTNRSPFPADYEYGILWGFIRKFSHQKQRYLVSYEDVDQREDKTKPEVRFVVKAQ